MLFLITLNTKSNFLFLISHIHIVFYTSLETFGNLKITNEINRLSGELTKKAEEKIRKHNAGKLQNRLIQCE